MQSKARSSRDKEDLKLGYSSPNSSPAGTRGWEILFRGRLPATFRRLSYPSPSRRPSATLAASVPLRSLPILPRLLLTRHSLIETSNFRLHPDPVRSNSKGILSKLGNGGVARRSGSSAGEGASEEKERPGKESRPSYSRREKNRRFELSKRTSRVLVLLKNGPSALCRGSLASSMAVTKGWVTEPSPALRGSVSQQPRNVPGI